ncbi:MAG: AAA family ATPase, partial [Aeromicrobium sp.]
MLIGRETELRVLEHLITGARVSRSGTLVVTGEAGIGKTSLIDAATSSVDGMNVLRAAGSPHEIGVAFGGLLQLLRPALGLIDAIPAPQSEALKVALAIRPGVPGDRFAIGAATLSLISRHAEDKPLVVIVDDAHDVDRPTAEALLFVARRLAADRVAIVMGARLGEPGLDTLRGLPELALAGLSEDAARSMLAAHATMTPEQAHRLHRATGGNPLAMVELADDPQSLDQLAPEVPVPAPAAVLQAFTRRATSLRPESRTALLAATIAGGDLTLAAAMCTQIGADVAALADAENADLVRIGVGTAEFRHPLVRSASYGAASTSDRRAMHQAAADSLHDSDAERSAWNLSEAAVGPDETVAGQMSLTGDAARSRGGYDVAAIAYERAAALTPGDDPLIAERLLAAAENAWLAGRAEHALELLERADRPPAPEKITARMCELRGAVAARAGSLEQARSILVAGVSAHAESDPDAALLLASDAVDICFFLADAQTAATMVETITTLLPRSTTARSQVLGTMAAGVGLVLIGSPGAELIRQASAEMERSAVVENYPFRAAWLMFGPLFLRDSNARRDHLRKAVEDRRTTASIVALPYMLFKLARDDATTDRWDDADIAYEESIRLARDTGQLTDLAMSLAGLAWLQARRGRSEPCLENAAESAELCGRHHI